MKDQLSEILKERTRLQKELEALPLIKTVYPTDANFILVKVDDANGVYKQLAAEGIIVRNRNKVTLCANCLRITVGTPEEDNILLNALKKMQNYSREIVKQEMEKNYKEVISSWFERKRSY